MNLFPKKLTLDGVTNDISTLKNHSDDIGDFLRQWYDDNDFISVHTSGSTGKPKLIRLNKTFVANSAKRTLNFFGLHENDRVLLCLPTRYIAGKLMIVRALLGGLDLCVMPANGDFSTLANRQKKPFRLVAMVVNQVVKLLNISDCFANIETLLIGGSALPQSLERALQKVPTACFVSYGMTETATHIAVRAVNGDNKSQWYHCLNGVYVSLENDCLAIDLLNNENNPIRLVTNDIAELRDNKTFKILGRADNVIISGGIKFFPETIEAKLSTHITEPFFIAAVPDERLGQKMVLVAEGEESDERELQLYRICEAQLLRYERPKHIVFASKLLRTETGKLIRYL